MMSELVYDMGVGKRERVLCASPEVPISVALLAALAHDDCAVG